MTTRQIWGQGLMKFARDNGWTRKNAKLFVHSCGLKAVRKAQNKWVLDNAAGIELAKALPAKQTVYRYLEELVRAARRFVPKAV